MKKLFKHTGAGHWVGSILIVAADSIEEAKKLIRSELDDCGLKDEPLNIEEIEIKESKIILCDSGDY